MNRRHGRKALDPFTRIQKWISEGKIAESQSGCWLWQGPLLPTGYASVGMSSKAVGEYVPGKSRNVRLHRWMYELHRANIPHGLDLDHLCRVRHCINPWHLEPVTRSVNLRRAVGIGSQWSSRTACSRGHAYTPENTRVDKQGHRVCRTCARTRYKREDAA